MCGVKKSENHDFSNVTYEVVTFRSVQNHP